MSGPPTLAPPGAGARIEKVMVIIYRGPCVSLQGPDCGVVELCFDRLGESINKLDAEAVADLNAALTALRALADVRGLLVTSRKSGFVAGADIKQLLPLLLRGEADIRAYVEAVVEALSALTRLPVPTVSAINGFALGGGLETALATDYRVVSTEAKVGFPEINVGLIPGAGGTVRLPRLAGAKIALEWIGGAREYEAGAALQAGVADVIAEPGRLRDEALAWLRRAVDGDLDWRSRRRKRSGLFTPDAEAVHRARARAQRAGPHFPAARIATDLLEAAAGVEIDEALALETDAFVEVAHTPAVRALMIQLISSKELRKKSLQLAAGGRPVKQAAVIGAGIMGGGIACASALSGVPIVMADIAPQPLEAAMQGARRLLAKQISSGKTASEKSDAPLALITPVLGLKSLGAADLVIEAVVERMDIKRQVLAAVEESAGAETVLASNTSSLSIGSMAQGLKRPQALVGMHFFSPVPMMPLVEIIKGPQSSESAVATAVAYVLALGKVPVVVKDCPGFLVNRILGAYLFAFMRLMHDGADFAQVDRAMEVFGWPMGPASLQDMVGIDTLDKALAGIADGYAHMRPEFETAVQLLARRGWYGQKSGRGYYRHDSGGERRSQRTPDVEVRAMLADLYGDRQASFSDEEIVDRLMLPMLLEAARCLDEHVAAGPEEIDMAMLLGAGFPRHLGGPLWYAETIGLREVIQRCARFAALGGLYVPGTGLRRRAAAGERIYSLIP